MQGFGGNHIRFREAQPVLDILIDAHAVGDCSRNMLKGPKGQRIEPTFERGADGDCPHRRRRRDDNLGPLGGHAVLLTSTRRTLHEDFLREGE